MPGDHPLNSYDISYVDEASQRLFLADRTNQAIDIFDAKNDKYIGRVGGMTGLMFKDGKPDGVWKRWDPQGFKNWEETYKDGVKLP